MNLYECLQTMQGYGVALTNNGGGLVVQSASFALDDSHKATLAAHKPLLLAILPSGAACPVGAVLDAVEAYIEREAIVLENTGNQTTTAQRVAVEQASRVLLDVMGKL